MSFKMPGLSRSIIKAVSKQGYESPTPIQSKAIPAILAGKDVLAAAQTGTGKTAGFTLPILQLLSQKPTKLPKHKIRALILTPTRELAAQIEASIETYGEFLKLNSTVVFGGVNIKPQKRKLLNGVDILTATPGRLLDLYNQGCIDFSSIEILVLDEADRMMDMGFILDIRRIIKLLPSKRQNLMFSATFSGDIRHMSKEILKNPVEIEVAARNSASASVEQLVYSVDKSMKSKLLSHLIRENNWQQVLIFTRTKNGADRLTSILEQAGINATAIHGNKSQNDRTKALKDFKEHKICALVATDIASRGLDISQLPNVVNFDLPDIREDYVHRIGRTGRAGATGTAVSLVSNDEKDLLIQIEGLLKHKIKKEIVDGFEPYNSLIVGVVSSKKLSASRRNYSTRYAQSASVPRNLIAVSRRGGRV
jgi:ATP-dependent RNA helicase RhlE